jgi:hypothetical protein
MGIIPLPENDRFSGETEHAPIYHIKERRKRDGLPRRVSHSAGEPFLTTGLRRGTFTRSGIPNRKGRRRSPASSGQTGRRKDYSDNKTGARIPGARFSLTVLWRYKFFILTVFERLIPELTAAGWDA